MTTPASPTPAPLIDAPKRRNRLVIAIVGIVVVLAVVGAVLFATGAFSGGGKAVRIGVVGASDPQWPVFVEAAKEQGIDVEIVNFSEYPQLNPALSEGEIDLNQFQHLVYLAQYNEGAGDDLTPVGATAIYPLGLYSQKHGSVDEIPRGGTVILPNDESNLARGLLLLQREGLLTLKGGGSSVSTLDDVDQAASKVTVTTVDAALTATSLPDADAVIINNDFITDAGLTADSALAQDDPSDPKALAYVNVFASRADDATNETYAKLARIFEDTPAVIDALVENSGGTAVPLKTPQAELQDLLTTTEKAVADQKAAR